MDQDLLKTSTKQRIIIGAIAILMIGSMIATYAGIVLGNQKGTEGTDTNALIIKAEKAYNEVANKVASASSDNFNKFINYKGEISAFNETEANQLNGVGTRDVLEGTGRSIDATDDVDYLAYYVGWCPDDSIFDATYNNVSNPTSFNKILDPGIGLIEGWKMGMIGMKLGGVRVVTIPGALAYGETTEICGGYNKPLRFMVMAVEKSGELATLAEELDLANLKLQYAYYGLDYDQIMSEEYPEDEEEYVEE